MAAGRRTRIKEAAGTDFFSSARSFPITVGTQITPGELSGYPVDLRFKSAKPSWPPSWLRPRTKQMHVATAQWALGCYERYLAGEGEEWLHAAIGAADYLLEEQEPDGAWPHGIPMPHSYRLDPPWLSGMAQGEGASVLLRIHKETGEERYADAARRALGPLRTPVRAGGTRALLDGSPFYEEYPTEPPSFVLNGGIFSLWGLYDAGVGLGDADAMRDFEAGVDTLAQNIRRWDTGYWSLYDLFPHPVLRNVASGAYHSLHTTQLRAMEVISPRPELEAAATRFEGYAASRLNPARAFAAKAAFRLISPRNHFFAQRVPWGESRRGRNVKLLPGGSSLVLGYHAVSPDWPSILAVTPDRLREQLDYLVRHGYSGSTFSEIVSGEAPEKAVAITFDDGYKSVLDHGFPILSDFGFPATVFVPTSLVGLSEPMSWPGIDNWVGGPHQDELRPMNWDELRGLRDAGWEIASHTRTHPKLPELADAELHDELAESREVCSREMGSTCRSIAYPYGAHDDRVVDATREAGYEAAGIVGLGPPDPLRWPRVGVYSMDHGARFRLKVSPLARTVRESGAGGALEKARRLGRSS